jgi:hypothetical protein
VRLLAAAAIAAAAAGSVAARVFTPTARAYTIPAAAYVSGLHVDGSKPTTLIDIANRSESPDDYYAISVLFFHADGNRAADQLDLAVPLTAGQNVTVDVGGLVSAYRAANDIAPFQGPVQVVIYGYTCVDLGTCPATATPRPFGPDVIDVSPVQAEGAAIYDAQVQWRAAQ